MKSDSAYAPPAYGAPADLSPDEYRQILRQEIEKLVEEKDIVALLDWCNKLTEELKNIQMDYDIKNLDVLQEELRNYFYKKYPKFARWRKF